MSIAATVVAVIGAAVSVLAAYVALETWLPAWQQLRRSLAQSSAAGPVPPPARAARLNRARRPRTEASARTRRW